MPASSRLAKQTEQFNQPPTGGFFEDEDMHTKGIMEYYTPAIGDPLHVVLPYVCWQRFRPIEKIGDIERYRAANVAAAFVFENDAIEYCAAHNGAVSPPADPAPCPSATERTPEAAPHPPS